MAQTILFSLFELKGWSGRWFAFRNMGLGISQWGEPQGCEWLKLLGSGAGDGFSIWPDFGRYAIMAAFPNQVLAKAALESPLWKAYATHSRNSQHHFLQAWMGHGAWSGSHPFRYEAEAPKAEESFAVLTRARIRPSRLHEFWAYVPSVSASIRQFPGRKFSVGIGEWPLIEQATLSIWSSQSEMKGYAYQGKQHAEVVRLTRERGWYSEELFARFRLLEPIQQDVTNALTIM